MKPDDKQPAWKETDALDRAFMCRLFLVIHHFLSQSESDKVHERILKWVAKNATKPQKQLKAKRT